MIFKPISTEKAVKLIDIDNTLVFEIPLSSSRDYAKKEFEKVFSVKVEKVRISIIANKKYAYIKLNKSNPAIDIATKLGMI